MTETTNKPKVKLVGEDGNAYAILGRCKNAAQKAGWTKEQIEKFMSEATSGDYNHLLATTMDYFDDYGVEDDEDEDDW